MSEASSSPGGVACGIVKRSIVIAGHRTSVSLEQAFWDRLKIIAGRREASVAGLIAAIDQGRKGQNLSSAIRVFVLEAPDRG